MNTQMVWKIIYQPAILQNEPVYMILFFPFYKILHPAFAIVISFLTQLINFSFRQSKYFSQLTYDSIELKSRVRA